jgi:hypothetical protein
MPIGKGLISLLISNVHRFVRLLADLGTQDIFLHILYRGPIHHNALRCLNGKVRFRNVLDPW